MISQRLLLRRNDVLNQDLLDAVLKKLGLNAYVSLGASSGGAEIFAPTRGQSDKRVEGFFSSEELEEFEKNGFTFAEEEYAVLNGQMVMAMARAANTVVRTLNFLPENPEADRQRAGGYLTVVDDSTGRSLLIMPVGTLPAEKVKKYHRFSREKAERLWTFINGGSGHLSSWQSRKAEKEQYGGAVLVNTNPGLITPPLPALIISFSGLSEFADEALGLLLGIRFNFLTREEAGHITTFSGNPLFQPLLKKLSW